MLLHCKRDELRKLWIEGIEHKHVLQLLDEIESIKQVPQRLEAYMASKHYLHATDMLVSRLMAGEMWCIFVCVSQLDREADMFVWFDGKQNEDSEKQKKVQIVVLCLKLWENLLTYVNAYEAILRQCAHSTHT